MEFRVQETAATTSANSQKQSSAATQESEKTIRKYPLELPAYTFLQLLTPVISLKPKVVSGEDSKPREIHKPRIIQQPIVPIIATAPVISGINEWEEFLSIEDEYNPAVPNEYEKIVKEKRERNKKEDLRKRHHSPTNYG